MTTKRCRKCRGERTVTDQEHFWCRTCVVTPDRNRLAALATPERIAEAGRRKIRTNWRWAIGFLTVMGLVMIGIIVVLHPELPAGSIAPYLMPGALAVLFLGGAAWAFVQSRRPIVPHVITVLAAAEWYVGKYKCCTIMAGFADGSDRQLSVYAPSRETYVTDKLDGPAIGSTGIAYITGGDLVMDYVPIADSEQAVAA